MPYARQDTVSWQPGMYYHIYNRGAHQLRIFQEPTNYLFVMRKIKEHAKANQISMIAYSLMPTHYHFLVRQDGDKPAGNLPQSVFNSYSKAYNKMYSHSGTLFEGRFRAKVIQADSHLLHLCRYIHGNPVKAGLVADPAEWPYSNYREWIEARSSTLVDREFIKEQFSSLAEYKKFLFQYLQTRDLPEDVQRHIWEIEKG
jgi:putative transposase